MDDKSKVEALELIREAALDSPGLYDQFSAQLTSCEGVDLNAFFEHVDQSDYSLTDWTEAFSGFCEWLESKSSRLRPFPEMIGYMHCCTMMNGATISLPSLKVTVYQSLTEYGFDVVGDS